MRQTKIDHNSDRRGGLTEVCIIFVTFSGYIMGYSFMILFNLFFWNQHLVIQLDFQSFGVVSR